MQYRTTTPSDNGFDNEHEEYANMHAFIQRMMDHSGQNELLDSVLVVANICENRALTRPDQKVWYSKTALFLRSALELLATDPNSACPQDKLENPLLYFPTPTTFQ